MMNIPCKIVLLSCFPKGNFIIQRLISSQTGNCLKQKLAGDDKLGQSTLNLNEAGKFETQALHWWDEQGSAKGLHSMNKLRVPFIREGLLTVYKQNSEIAHGQFPLQGFTILDVGCGGGILSEALARLGAKVTGLDPVNEILEVAKLHASKDPELAETLKYRQGTVEELRESNFEPFDAVVASEVIEHVDNPEGFVNHCVNLIKPGGSLFFTTINRTLVARLLAVKAAEDVMNIVPSGTHQYEKFVTPEELISWCERNDCSVRLLHGMLYNPFSDSWSWSRYTNIHYVVHAIKTVKKPAFSSAMDEDLRKVREGTPNLSASSHKTSVN